MLGLALPLQGQWEGDREGPVWRTLSQTSNEASLYWGWLRSQAKVGMAVHVCVQGVYISICVSVHALLGGGGKRLLHISGAKLQQAVTCYSVCAMPLCQAPHP